MQQILLDLWYHLFYLKSYEKVPNIYVDPFMVIISSVIFIRVPVVTLINSFKEIVNVNADDDINNKIYTIVKDIEEDYNFEDSITRVSKVGRELRIG